MEEVYPRLLILSLLSILPIQLMKLSIIGIIQHTRSELISFI
jgi:hypothetical protein